MMSKSGVAVPLELLSRKVSGFIIEKFVTCPEPGVPEKCRDVSFVYVIPKE